MARVLLIRADGPDDRDAVLLRAAGLEVVADPYLVIRPSQDPGAVERARAAIAEVADHADWLLVTSRNAVGALRELAGEDALRHAISTGQRRGLRIAAVGEVTAGAITEVGGHHVQIPEVSTAAGLSAHLVDSCAPGSAVLPRGNVAMAGLAAALRAAGWAVNDPIVYETSTVDREPDSAQALASGEFDAVVVRSPSAARALARFAPRLPASTAVVCGGPTTAAEARGLGLATIVQAAEPTGACVCEAVVLAVTDGDRR